MNKNILKLLSLLLICSFVSIVSYCVYYAYKVPIEKLVLITVKSGTSEDLIENLKDDLNGQYKNIYDTIGRDDCTDYVIKVNAPLVDILSYDNITDNPNVVNLFYEWELKTLSALHHEM